MSKEKNEDRRPRTKSTREHSAWHALACAAIEAGEEPGRVLAQLRKDYSSIKRRKA